MTTSKIFSAAILSMLAVILMTTILFALDDIEEHRRCAQCGMDRKDFGFSRVLLRHDDGTTVGTCSLHCAKMQLDANPARKVKGIEVADRNTRTLIDAKKAYWVIGGDKGGVMTKTATWAFAKNEDAATYVKEHGGRLASFNESLETVTKELPKKEGAVKMDIQGHKRH